MIQASGSSVSSVGSSPAFSRWVWSGAAAARCSRDDWPRGGLSSGLVAYQSGAGLVGFPLSNLSTHPPPGRPGGVS